jgi:hypothetical protein
MEITYCCPFWGCEKDSPEVFFQKVLSSQYGGIEILLPPSTASFTKIFIENLENLLKKDPSFIFIAQQLTSPDNYAVDEYICRMEKKLIELAGLQPTFIN